MRIGDADLLAKVRLDLQQFASQVGAAKEVELPTILTLPRYVNPTSRAEFLPDLRRIVLFGLPQDLVRAARAVFAIGGDDQDPALDFSAGIPSLTARERAIADNGTARRWMRQAVLSEVAIRLTTLAAPRLIAPGEHASSFHVGQLSVHVEHTLNGDEEVCNSVQFRWHLSPNDKARCFDWELDELPSRLTSSIESVVVVDDRGRELPSTVVDRPLHPLLLVYLHRSAQDEWLELTATLKLARDAKPIGRIRFDNDLRRQRHPVNDVTLSAEFADATRTRRVGYFKFPNMWKPPREEFETLAPGLRAILRFVPNGDNEYTLAWDLPVDSTAAPAPSL